MSSQRKHRRSESPKVEQQNKAPRIEDARKDLTASLNGSFRIETNLRSLSKAELNDPKPPEYWKNRWETLKERSNAGQADTTELERVDIQESKEPLTQQQPPRRSEMTKSSTVGDEGGLAEEDLVEGDLAQDDLAQDGLIEDDLTEDDLTEDDLAEDDFDENLEEASSACGSEYDEFAEFKWLELMDGKVKWIPADNSKITTIGYCNGKLIRRDTIQNIFHDKMEMPTSETSQLAFDLFDRYGRLRNEFKTHIMKKGSGIWQDELDEGDLLLIEYLHIETLYRRRGLGSKVFTDIFEKTRGKTNHPFFALVRPGYLVRESEAEMGNLTDEERDAFQCRAEHVARNFYRYLGFRRIGSSSWFGLASDPEHSCHSLLASSDYDSPTPSTHTPCLDIEALLGTISINTDDECVERLSQKLQDAATGDPRWQVKDERGNTLLHIASINHRPKTVQWILKQNSSSGLLDIRNHQGETPLEALQFHLEADRLRRVSNNFFLSVPTSDKFEGFSEAAVDCLAHLKCIDELSHVERLRLTFGCTCGSCIGGFLSPRMSLALQCQAEINHDMLYQFFQDYSGPGFVSLMDDQLLFLQPSVRTNLTTNKSMREGFVNFFKHFASCLRNKKLPIEPFIMQAMENESEWPPVSKNFLQRGGTVYSVASMIFKNAMDEDRWAGDGNHWDVFEDDILQLPSCRNDHEFGFVSGMCGFERVS